MLLPVICFDTILYTTDFQKSFAEWIAKGKNITQDKAVGFSFFFSIDKDQVSASFSGKPKIIYNTTQPNQPMLDTGRFKDVLPEVKSIGSNLLVEAMESDRLFMATSLAMPTKPNKNQTWTAHYFEHGAVLLKSDVPLGWSDLDDCSPEFVKNWFYENIRIVSPKQSSAHNALKNILIMQKNAMALVERDYHTLSKVTGQNPKNEVLKDIFRKPENLSLEMKSI